MYSNYDEYMRAIIGEPIQRMNPNLYVDNNVNRTMYNHTQNFNLPEPNMETIDLYPDIFLKLNPIVINRCKNIGTTKISKEVVLQLTEEIYMSLDEQTRNNKQQNNFLRDIIRLLILNQLLQNRTQVLNRNYHNQYLKF